MIIYIISMTRLTPLTPPSLAYNIEWKLHVPWLGKRHGLSRYKARKIVLLFLWWVLQKEEVFARKRFQREFLYMHFGGISDNVEKWPWKKKAEHSEEINLWESVIFQSQV